MKERCVNVAAATPLLCWLSGCANEEVTMYQVVYNGQIMTFESKPDLAAWIKDQRES